MNVLKKRMNSPLPPCRPIRIQKKRIDRGRYPGGLESDGWWSVLGG
jgi:hypothetical protein